MNWYEFDQKEKTKEYYKNLSDFVYGEYDRTECFPPKKKILNALQLTPYDTVKVVILGQDPYHGIGQAMGLSFSVPKNTVIPPSLRNIYTELQSEFGYPIPKSGDLTPWAKQGVLLLNAVLTVQAHKPGSHAGKGWEIYTDRILEELNKKDTPVVFMLWGNYARAKKYLITNPRHYVLESPHPSPFSANHGFFGCDHFKKCNNFLKTNGIAEINWQIV